MKFRPRVPAAYAPAQAAPGEAPDGRPTLLLFIPQWVDTLRRVSEAEAGAAPADATAAGVAPNDGAPAAVTQWAFSREIEMPVLFVRFVGGEEIGVTFSPSMMREVLTWWERHGRVDVLFTTTHVERVDPGAATGDAAGSFVRVPDVPFMTADG